MPFSKIIGSIFLLMGTLIGGGILAIPLVTSGSSFLTAATLLTFMWLLMLICGFLFLEVNLAFANSDINFSSMAYYTLGKVGKTITAISYLILLYSLVGAYVSAGGSLLSSLLKLMHINVPTLMCSFGFVIILGYAVFHGIKTVDYLNRFFFSIKGVLLVLVIALSISKINFSNLILATHSSKYLLAAAPIYLSAFGYHILIPPLSKYLNYDIKSIKKVLFLGSFFTWLLYIFWLAVTMGVIPLDGFLTLAKQNGSVGEFILLFCSFLKSRAIETFIQAFANITVITCFLGVSLGLFDFLFDFLKKQKNIQGKLQILVFTFLPPMIFVMFYPKGFILALGNAAICVAFSHVMLPALMVYKLRQKEIKSPYNVKGGNWILGSILFIGALLIVLQLLVDLNALPVFGK